MDKLDLHLKALGIVPFGTGSFLPASQEQVHTLESQLGATLPAEYRFVLLHYGAFTFDKPVVFHGEDGGKYDFGYFFDINFIQEHVVSPPDQFPPECLAIGDEGLGNLYCLGLKNRFADKVLYWEHDVGWGDEAEEYVIKGLPIPEGVDTPCLHTIANSMASFLQRLRS